ncbi:MAG: PEPxxWA-CTERM sorting domain-containing protein [Sphingomonas phyllosphaerae]|uniref:PEPxxWA-CTERM sorting domain-containing protein n=1 Tax=Sphingomonas phyllosphaerae TaxID=257003 RepID=UPI002FF9BD9E
MKFLKKLAGLAAFCSLSLAGASAQAATLDFVYQGILLSNATATGSFDIDDAELARLNAGSTPLTRAKWSAVSNLVLTVSGAKWGNGTFTTADFIDLEFYLPTTLDLGKELVGQRVDATHDFGQPDSGALAGDLTFTPLAKADATKNGPSAARTFTLLAYGGYDYMQLKSLKVTAAPAVPEPSTWAMMIVGIGVVGVALRRQRRAARVSLV